MKLFNRTASGGVSPASANPLIADLDAERLALESADGSRVERMKQYRAELEGHRDASLRGAAAEVSDYGRQLSSGSQTPKHDIRMPYGLAQVIKHTERTGGRLPDLVVPRLDGSQRETWRQGQVEKMLYQSWNASGAEVQLADATWDGSALGACVFEACFDLRYGRVPTFRSLDPVTVSVVPGEHRPDVITRIFRSWYSPRASVVNEYQGKAVDLDDVDLGPVDVELLPEGEHRGGVDLIRVHEALTDESRYRWAGGLLLHRQQHGYGFCPAVVVPNVGPHRMLWGYSDYELVRSVTAYYERLMSRQADIIRFVANGTFTARATGLAADVIHRGIRNGGVLPIKVDGELRALDPPAQPPFVDSHLQNMQQAMNDLGFTPPASWGNGANTTSGSERQMAMFPQGELASLKQSNLAYGLTRLNEMLLKLWEKKVPDSGTYRGTMTRGGRTRSYQLGVGDAAQPPDQAVTLPAEAPADQFTMDPELQADPAIPETNPLPRTPAETIDGDYANAVLFAAHLDVHDPQFVLAEINKFNAGIQSAQTTLERLGFESPEDELQLVEAESQRMPWVRQGMIALLQMQLDAAMAEGQGSGAPTVDSGAGGDLAGAMSSMTDGANATGAINFDALNSAINGNAERGAAPGGMPGVPYGAA